MKNIITVLLTLFLSVTLTASPDGTTPQERYIDKYAPLAVSEMYRSGVPASITLAQGLLESGNGQSELARKSNNHFGIKCHNNWKGGRVYHDDDAKGECFRKYSHPSESYRDHSDFLRYRDRYKFLFDYRITDYKAWAYGLKKAGYATDPKYPKKLIELIEKYDLHKYDRKPVAFGKTYDKKSERNGNKDNQSKKSTKTVIEFVGEVLPEEEVAENIPQSPTAVEQVKELDERKREEFHFSLSRKVYTQNNVPFVYAEVGDSYASIAASHNLFAREVLRFNDLKKESELLPGTIVYLKPKRKSAAKGIDKYVFEEGDDLRDIAQRFGVRLESIMRLNGLEEGTVPRGGDIIRLRK